jgi:hypothetical protein
VDRFWKLILGGGAFLAGSVVISAWARGRGPRLGVWVDQMPGQVLRDGWFRQISGLGFQTLSPMFDASPFGWDPRWSDGQVGELVDMARRWRLAVAATVWPDPSIETIPRLIDALHRWAPLGIRHVNVNIEPLWTRAPESEYRPAADLLVEGLLSLKRDFGTVLELDTHTGHREITQRALISPYMDRIGVMAYSVREGNSGELYSWSDPARGPGLAQDRAFRLVQRVPGVPEGEIQLVAGLAAWSQQWPGHPQSEALGLAYDAALRWSPAEIRYWSSRHILGSGGVEVRRWLGGGRG